MASSYNKAHLRKAKEKNQMRDDALHPSPFGIYDLLNTQKCLKDFFVQRGMFGDCMAVSEAEQNLTSNLKAKERDEKINNIIKGIVEKSIADIAKMRQLIALWDAEERSTSHSYIDESSYGLVTQQKIKQYLRDFFSERLTSAEPPIELHSSADFGQDICGQDSSPERAKEEAQEDAVSSVSSPIIEKAKNMFSQVMQPVVDTFESATKVTKAVVKMLSRNDRDDQEMTNESNEGAQRNSPAHAPKDDLVRLSEERNQILRLSPAMQQAVEDSPSPNMMSGRNDDGLGPPAMFNEAVLDELCNLQLTPRLSPILEETGETISSASSSAILDKMCLFDGESISSLLVASASTAMAGSSAPTPATSTPTLERTKTQSEGPPQRKEAERPRTAELKLTPRLSPFCCRKPNVISDSADEKISNAESPEEQGPKVTYTLEGWYTARLLGISPVPSPVRSPILEKAKNIISQVIQPVVHTIDSASKVTKTAGKSIAKKVKSMWKYRSGRKKGKRGRGKNKKNTGRTGHKDILDKENDNEEGKTEDEEDAEDEEEEEEKASTAKVDSIRALSSALNQGGVVGSSEVPPCIIEDTTVQKPAEVLGDVAVEEFCFFEAEASSVISTPFLDPRTARSCDPTSSALSVPQHAKSENRTPDFLKDEQLSCNSIGLSARENKLRVLETDDEQASELNPLLSEEDGPEHNIYSIFENIFREEFSKKLENSLRQGLCDAVRVYVPERSSTESSESANVDNYTKQEIDTSSVGPQDSLESGCTSITSFTSYQLLEDGIPKKHLSDVSLKGIPPEGLDPKRKSLWKRWKMRRARKILPGLLDCHCTHRATDSTASGDKATEPAIKTILKKVTSIWK